MTHGPELTGANCRFSGSAKSRTGSVRFEINRFTKMRTGLVPMPTVVVDHDSWYSLCTVSGHFPYHAFTSDTFYAWLSAAFIVNSIWLFEGQLHLARQPHCRLQPRSSSPNATLKLCSASGAGTSIERRRARIITCLAFSCFYIISEPSQFFTFGLAQTPSALSRFLYSV